MRFQVRSSRDASFATALSEARLGKGYVFLFLRSYYQHVQIISYYRLQQRSTALLIWIATVVSVHWHHYAKIWWGKRGTIKFLTLLYVVYWEEAFYVTESSLSEWTFNDMKGSFPIYYVKQRERLFVSSSCSSEFRRINHKNFTSCMWKERVTIGYHHPLLWHAGVKRFMNPI